MTRDGSKNWARLGPRWHTHSTISWRNPNFILEETLISLKRNLWLQIAKFYICNYCQSLTNIQRFHQYVLSGAKKLVSICSVFYICVCWMLNDFWPSLLHPYALLVIMRSSATWWAFNNALQWTQTLKWNIHGPILDLSYWSSKPFNLRIYLIYIYI